MFKWNAEVAAKTSKELALANLEKCTEFVSPEKVINFIDEVFNYLTQTPENTN